MAYCSYYMSIKDTCVYSATLSGGHNLIKTDDIVWKHIKHYEVKTLHKLCVYSLHSSLDLITQLKQQAALSQFWRSSCSSQGYIKSTVRVTACNELWHQASFFDVLGVAASSWTPILLKLYLKIPDAAEKLAILALHPASFLRFSFTTFSSLKVLF